MRLADFAGDEDAAATAEDIGRALVVDRARVQQRRLGRLLESVEPLASEALAPPRRELLYGSAVIDDGERMRAVLLVDAPPPRGGRRPTPTDPPSAGSGTTP